MWWTQLLAVWVLADWKAWGEATPLQLVELGPGRGTLLKDILRVSVKRCLWNFLSLHCVRVYVQVFQHKQLRAITRGLSLHLVEASPALSSIQQATLQATPTDHTHSSSYKSGDVEGIPVFWYQELEQVPQGKGSLHYRGGAV